MHLSAHGTLLIPESGVGNIANARKKPYHVLDFYVQGWCWMGSFFYSYPCDLVLLHWFLSRYIFLVGDFFRLRWWRLRHWHLGVDTCWMSPHTSSVLPWSGAPKVCLYSTFLSSLRHLPPRMKNQHGLNEEKIFIGTKWAPFWVLVMCYVWLVWVLTT